MKPSVFIGSSSEGEAYAEAISVHLSASCLPVSWRGVFELSGSTMGSLMGALDRFEYAVFVLTPDDAVLSRKTIQLTARDNLFFEMGLFISRLGMERVFFAVPASVKDFRKPSDLAGITHGLYDDEKLVKEGDEKSDKDYAVATLGFSTLVEQLIDRDQRYYRLRPYTINGSILIGEWEAAYQGGLEHFEIDAIGRYVLGFDKQVLYVARIIKETPTYVEFVRIPVRTGYKHPNTSKFDILDYNTLRGQESDGSTTTYRRTGVARSPL
jgi:hypothetical protein